MHTNYTLVPFIPHDSYMYCTIVDFEFTTFSIILAEFFLYILLRSGFSYLSDYNQYFLGCFCT